MAGRWTAVLSSMTVAALLVSCGGRAKPPASPTETLEPVVVGLIASAMPDGIGAVTGSVTLDDGSTLALGLQQVRLTPPFGQLKPGDLMLAGPGSSPAWWIDLDSKIRVVPSGRPAASPVPDGACWLMEGGAFDVGDAIHFANGLLLKKAPGFRIVYDWIPDPFPTRDGDRFCVNRDGQVTSLDFIWEPY
jgi:hypothetical protein